MSYIEYLKEFFDDEDTDEDTDEETVESIIKDQYSEIKELIKSNDYTMEPEEVNQEVSFVIDLLTKALEFRNIDNGKRFFDEKILNHFRISEEEYLRKHLSEILNYVQRQSTKIEPNYYV